MKSLHSLRLAAVLGREPAAAAGSEAAATRIALETTATALAAGATITATATTTAVAIAKATGAYAPLLNVDLLGANLVRIGSNGSVVSRLVGEVNKCAVLTSCQHHSNRTELDDGQDAPSDDSRQSTTACRNETGRPSAALRRPSQ